MYNFPKLNQEEIDNTIRPIMSMENGNVIKLFQQTKAQGQMDLQANSTKSLEKR